MNLASVNYWSTQNAFVDRMKTSAAWTTFDKTKDVIAPPLNANGEPTGIPAGYTQLASYIAVDPGDDDIPDRYVLFYDGKGTFSIPNVTIISNEPGKIVFDVPVEKKGIVQLLIKSLDATNPAHDIHVVRQDQMADFNAGTLFNPAFLEKAALWDTLRFMDWGRTNMNEAVSWDDRPLATDASYYQSGGVPLEVMVRLANEARSDMWWNVPTMADDAYVRSALTYIRDNLAPGLTLKVEWSNEVWNTSFDQSGYAQTEANKLWAVDTSKNSVIDTDEAVVKGNLVYYGYRSAQVAAIANEVFGRDSDGRLETVITTGQMSADKFIFQGVEKAGLGTAGELFDDYAITTYFGNSLSAAGRIAADREKVLGWARGGQAGIDAAFEELSVGGLLSKSDSINDILDKFTYQQSVAEKYGLKLVAYEGGAHVTAATWPTALREEMAAFFAKLMNDPRMGGLYTGMVDNFASAGGTDLVAFIDAGGSKVTGYWGILDDIYDSGSARFDALKAAAARASSGPVARQTIAIESGLLMGSAAADTLTGSDGDDTIDGGAGADRMIGGKGNDVYIVDHARDTVVEAAGGGIDLVKAGVTYTLAAEVEHLALTGTAAIDGTGNALGNHIVGNAAANKLYGLAGNDTIEGGAGDDYLDGGEGDDMLSGGSGADTLLGGNGNDTLVGGGGADNMVGGKGNDTYILDNAAQVVVELPGGGIDLIRSTFSITLSANVENLTLIGTGLAGTGNDGNNAMNFSAEGGGTLSGLAGRDTLTGGAGNDTLDGGADSDTLFGGEGDDVLIGGAGADRMTGGEGADRFVIRHGETGATGSTGDTITDFNRDEGDRIDLSGWDAVSSTATDDPFRFIGTGRFTKVAGELRIQSSGTTGNVWAVQADTNGDGIADLYLTVTSQSGALVANDFVL